ncbi:MAG: prepilin peptidase [Saezia sp.]
MLLDLDVLPSSAIIGAIFLFGLLFGSFLNVVIYRVPKNLDQEQDQGVGEYLEQKVSKKDTLGFIPLGYQCPHCSTQSSLDKGVYILPEDQRPAPAKPFNLFTPGSACPGCGHKIRWWENIPVLSWLLLRGKCSSCKQRISFRYPFVELLTATLFGIVAWHFGASIQTLLWCFFVFICIAISGIDWDTTWLPDSLSLSLMWVGVIAALVGWSIPIQNALWGAIIGYMTLWLLATAFHSATGRMGMASGDFKLMAALGAWFGWEFLLPIALISSVVGIFAFITLKLLQSQTGLFENKYMPFGPFLAGAGLLLLIITPAKLLQIFPFLQLNF